MKTTRDLICEPPFDAAAAWCLVAVHDQVKSSGVPPGLDQASAAFGKIAHGAVDRSGLTEEIFLPSVPSDAARRLSVMGIGAASWR